MLGLGGLGGAILRVKSRRNGDPGDGSDSFDVHYIKSYEKSALEVSSELSQHFNANSYIAKASDTDRRQLEPTVSCLFAV